MKGFCMVTKVAPPNHRRSLIGMTLRVLITVLASCVLPRTCQVSVNTTALNKNICEVGSKTAGDYSGKMFA